MPIGGTGLAVLMATAVTLTGAIPMEPRMDEVSDGAAPQEPQERTRAYLARHGATRQIIAGRKVDIWRPVPSEAPSPLIVFSHGFSGCGVQSSFLMRALADAGYLVVAPNHADAHCADGPWTPFGALPEPPFHAYRRWNEESYSARRDDVRAVMDAVLTDPDFNADSERVGLVGHSLGGYTVLGLAGAWPGWRTPGLRAVVALSPWCAPFLAANSLGGVAVPVQYQGGALDFGLTPTVRRRGGCYDATPPPAAFIEFSGAGHLAWTDARSRHQQQIVRYTLAWLDHYVRDKPGAAVPDLEVQVRDQRLKERR